MDNAPELTLSALAAYLDSRKARTYGPAPKRVKCDGGPAVFAQFGPCRCTDCEPAEVAR